MTEDDGFAVRARCHGGKVSIEILPPGEFRIVADEELIEELSFPASIAAWPP